MYVTTYIGIKVSKMNESFMILTVGMMAMLAMLELSTKKGVFEDIDIKKISIRSRVQDVKSEKI